jgi:hypothetical protein
MLNRPVPTDNIHTNIIRALNILITKFTIPVEVVQAEYPFQTIKMSSVIWKYIRMHVSLLFISVMHTCMYPLLMVDRNTSNCCSTKFQYLKKMKGAALVIDRTSIDLTVKVILPLPWVSKVRKTYFTYIPTSDVWK